MATHNVQLFDAALAGYLGGAVNGHTQTDPTAADYAGLVTSAVNFATAVDAAIPADAALITPVDKYTLSHVNLLKSLCNEISASGASTPQANFAVTAAAIAALYSQAAAQLL